MDPDCFSGNAYAIFNPSLTRRQNVPTDDVEGSASSRRIVVPSRP